MPHVKTDDGTRIAYQCEGEGDPLLLLSGQASNHHWWDQIRDDLHAAGRSTVTLDYRGAGESDKPDSRYSTQGFAQDVTAVLDDLGIGRIDVYGTSMGGRVAQWLAARHPDRVRTLVLGATTVGGRRAAERGLEVRKSLSEPEKMRDVLLTLMYSPAWLEAHPEGPYPTLGDAAMPPPIRLLHLAASNQHDAWDILPEITAPTLVVQGDEDLLNPFANGPLLAWRIPDARLAVVEGARHAYYHEFSDIATPLVLDFLEAAEPRR